jgi:hypothetical protein
VRKKFQTKGQTIARERQTLNAPAAVIARFGDGEFALGFWFAINVLWSMVDIPSSGEVVEQLEAVARGELSLMPSLDEAVREHEVESGEPISNDMKELFRQALSNRREVDASQQVSARRVLSVKVWPAGFGPV